MESLVGEIVIVRGKPFGALTVHHHAPIVMEISGIDSPSSTNDDNRDYTGPVTRRKSSTRCAHKMMPSLEKNVICIFKV